jgi:hypothetical protein
VTTALRSPKPEATFFLEAGACSLRTLKKTDTLGKGSFAQCANAVLPLAMSALPDVRGLSRTSQGVAEIRVSFRSGSAENLFGYDCGIAVAEGETMRGRQSAKKYKQYTDASRVVGIEESLHIESVVGGKLTYRVFAADFPISCRESDWVLKLGPPPG